MTQITVNVIEDLLNEGLTTKEIAEIMSNDYIRSSLESGKYFECVDSVAEFGKDNSDNALYDGEDYETWGEFLLSAPGQNNSIKLSTGTIFSVIE